MVITSPSTLQGMPLASLIHDVAELDLVNVPLEATPASHQNVQSDAEMSVARQVTLLSFAQR